MAKQEDLRLRTGVEGAEESARAIDKITEAQKKQAQETLNSRGASKGARNEALAVVRAFDEQVAAERRAGNAAEAMAASLRELKEVEGQLGQARKSGTVGQVEALSDKMDVARRKARDLGVAEEKLRAGEGDYLDILRQVDPQLGALADGMLKGSKVAGDLASKNISLGGALSKATAAMKNNAGALKLMAAGGAVVLGVIAIQQAFAKMAADAERVAAAVKSQVAAENERKRAQQTRSQSIEDVSDARRGGGFDAETARAARETAGRIGKKFGALQEGNVDQAVGSLFDRGFSEQELAEAAFLQQRGSLQIDTQASPQAQRRAFERAKRRGAGAISTFFGREGEQSSSVSRDAQSELGAAGGSTAAIQAAIAALPGDAESGIDPERLAKIVQLIGDAKFSDPSTKQKKSGLANPISFGLDILGFDTLDSELELDTGVEDILPSEVRTAEVVRKSLDRQRSKTAAPPVTNHFYNQTVLGFRKGTVENGKNSVENRGAE